MHINREDRLVDMWLTQPKHTHATLSYSGELDSSPSHTPKYFILYTLFRAVYFSSTDLNSYVNYICYIVDLGNTSDDFQTYFKSQKLFHSWTSLWPDEQGYLNNYYPISSLRVKTTHLLTYDVKTPIHFTWLFLGVHRILVSTNNR